MSALADRTPRTIHHGPNAAGVLEPWDTGQVCRFLGCSERHLRTLRADEDRPFPAPLGTPRLAWWPADVLAYVGLDLEEYLEVAHRCDASGFDGREVG